MVGGDFLETLPARLPADTARTFCRLRRALVFFLIFSRRARIASRRPCSASADAEHGRRDAILARREKIKKKTRARRKRQNVRAVSAGKRAGSVSKKSPPTIPTQLTTYRRRSGEKGR